MWSGRAAWARVHYSLPHHINTKYKAEIAKRNESTMSWVQLLLHCLTFLQKTVSLYRCLECVISGLQPFPLVYNTIMRRQAKHDSIRCNILVTYMYCLAKVVEDKIRSGLSERFVIVLDAWSAGATPFVVVFAMFPSFGTFSCWQVLLRFSPMGLEDFQGAEDYYEYAKYV